MNLFTAFRISHDGLSSQRTRLNTVASNLANINTTRTEEGGPYKKKMPVFEANKLEEIFPENEDNDINESMFDNDLNDIVNEGNSVSSVKINSIEEDKKPPRMVYEPNHPDANKDGYVAYPNIDPVMEMVDLISTTRSYEANVSVVDSIKKMATQAISIGR
jgi:flagellar basal-body rod protein FlgC